MTGRQRVLSAIAGRETDRTAFMPITMMFAADRAGVPYGRYAANYRVLCEAQARVAEEFSIDHVSAISDPAREAADLGAVIEWFDDQPPAIDGNAALLRDKRTLLGLKPADPLGGGRMHDRVRAVEWLAARLGGEELIEGWVEGPCAEAADLRGINTLMVDFVDDPGFVRDVFEFVVDMALRFAKAQVDAGADLIGVGDAAASLIGPSIYQGQVWPYQRRLVDGLHAMGAKVRLHICGKTRRIFTGMGRLGCEIVDLDWPAPVAEARLKMGPDQVLLGNVDPVAVLRNGRAAGIAEAIAECRREAGPRYIVGAGCEVVRDTPPENLRALRLE